MDLFNRVYELPRGGYAMQVVETPKKLEVSYYELEGGAPDPIGSLLMALPLTDVEALRDGLTDYLERGETITSLNSDDPPDDDDDGLQEDDEEEDPLDEPDEDEEEEEDPRTDLSHDPAGKAALKKLKEERKREEAEKQKPPLTSAEEETRSDSSSETKASPPKASGQGEPNEDGDFVIERNMVAAVAGEIHIDKDIDLTPAEARVIDVIDQYPNEEEPPSISFINKYAGMKKKEVEETVKSLLKKEMIVVLDDDGEYLDNSDDAIDLLELITEAKKSPKQDALKDQGTGQDDDDLKPIDVRILKILKANHEEYLESGKGQSSTAVRKILNKNRPADAAEISAARVTASFGRLVSNGLAEVTPDSKTQYIATADGIEYLEMKGS